MDTYHNADTLDLLLSLARRCNKYIDETTPWVLARDEAARPVSTTCCTVCWSASGGWVFCCAPSFPLRRTAS